MRKGFFLLFLFLGMGVQKIQARVFALHIYDLRAPFAVSRVDKLELGLGLGNSYLSFMAGMNFFLNLDHWIQAYARPSLVPFLHFGEDSLFLGLAGRLGAGIVMHFKPLFLRLGLDFSALEVALGVGNDDPFLGMLFWENLAVHFGIGFHF